MESGSDARAAYAANLGNVPPTVETALRHVPDQLAGYMAMRAAILERDDALPRRYAHLILAVLDVTQTHIDGAVNHARTALRMGVSWEELTQALTLMWITHGFATAWGNAGAEVVDRLVELGEGPAASTADGAGTSPASAPAPASGEAS
jgi:alkylhydroperoxidase/carboxymuconolactone decarboxylase family protein YurZ